MKLPNHTLIDFLSKDQGHLNFNKSFIKALSEFDSSYQILGIQSHIKKLESIEGLEALSIRDKKWWVLEVISLFFLLKKQKTKKITALAFENYFFPTFLVLFFPCFFRTKIKLIVHNNVSAIKNNILKRIPLLIATKIFNIQFLCLSKTGLEAMNKIGFKNTKYIPHMNFTHSYHEIGKSPIHFRKDKTNIILLGRQVDLFAKYQLPKVDISEFSNLQFYLFKTVELKSKPKNLKVFKQRLSDKEFSATLKEADFCLFPNIDVDVRASGILLDAISNYCPIIAPNEGHFKEFNEDKIGFFYSDNSVLFDLFSIINKKKLKRKHFKKSLFQVPLKNTSIIEFKKQLVYFYEAD